MSPTNSAITFPEDELPAYRERLAAGKVIYTTRVSREVGRYRVGVTYSSPLGRLTVTHVTHLSALEEHPFFAELTPGQRAEIARYLPEGGMDVVALRRAAADAQTENR